MGPKEDFLECSVIQIMKKGFYTHATKLQVPYSDKPISCGILILENEYVYISLFLCHDL